MYIYIYSDAIMSYYHLVCFIISIMIVVYY